MGLVACHRDDATNSLGNPRLFRYNEIFNVSSLCNVTAVSVDK